MAKGFFKHYHSGPLFMRWFGLKCVGKGREKKGPWEKRAAPKPRRVRQAGRFLHKPGLPCGNLGLMPGNLPHE